MAKWEIQLDADALNKVLSGAFPLSNGGDRIREVTPGRIRIVQPFHRAMLRPGNLISGPTLMNLADMAAYALVMAHVGVELMAVTSSLTMHFLRGAQPGDIVAEGELLSLGRRMAVSDVRIWTESPERLAAQATVTYARAPAA
ncbi:MAG TPA: PaaI family thioesterase [Caulobacteraceae bacterium]|jgi:uncharacterized protein (TIGR00369 family)|nr:PaaI family thioesterase [Caulobacteraceae bacterium]